MHASHTALGRAFALSLLLHAVMIAAAGRFAPSPRHDSSMQAALSVWLREERAAVPLELPAAPPLPAIVPHAEPERPRIARIVRSAPAAPVRPAGTAVRLEGEAARAANTQMAQALFYPLEAVERGLEGEATVLLFLDASGNVIASRLEASSGHALLDDAALAAARSLRGLPDSAPREALLPVRFRLRQ